MNIFVWREDQETGPFSWDEASACLQRGDFAAEDFARTEAMTEWKPLRALLLEMLAQIYLSRDGQESGPFTRDEIFARLLAGAFTEEEMGYTGASTDLRPLNEILKVTSCNFQVSQLEVPEPEPILQWFPTLPAGPSRQVSVVKEIDPERRFGERKIIVVAAALALVAFAICFYWFRSPGEVPEPGNLAGVPVAPHAVTPAPPTARPKAALAQAVASANPIAATGMPPAGPSSAAAVEEKPMPPAALPPSQTTLLQLALASESPQPAASESSQLAKSGSAASSGSNESPLPADQPGATKVRKPKRTPTPAPTPVPQYEQVAFTGRVVDPDPQDSGYNHLTEPQLTSIITDRMQLTPEPINEHYGERIDPRSTIYEGKFYLDTNLKWNPQVEVLYSLPMRSKTQHGPYANNIIMMGFWHAVIAPRKPKKPTPAAQPQQEQDQDSQQDADGSKQNNRLDQLDHDVGQLDHDQGQIDQQLDRDPSEPDPFGDGDNEPANRRGKPIVGGTAAQEPRDPLYDQLAYFSQGLGFTAFTMRIRTDHHDMLNPTEAYYMGGPEWQDIVFRAQAEITRLQKLQPRKLMLYGHSQGGMFVERIAIAQPDRVAAAAVESACATLPPVTGAGPTWFLGITRGDANTGEYLDLTAKLRGLGAQVLYQRFPPDYALMGFTGEKYHDETTLERAASRAYLRGVADMTDSNGQVDPKQWPYMRDINVPMRIVQAGSYQADSIPEANREYLPSQEFVRLIQSVPADMQFLTIPGRMAIPVRCLVALPPLGRVKGVVVYCDAPGYRDMATTINNMYYLAGLNYVVISPNMNSSTGDPLGATLALIQRWDVLKNLPLAFIGVGPKANDAWNFAAFNRDVPLKAIAVSEFDPKDSLDQSKLPPGGGINCPALFVYEERDEDRVRDASQAMAAQARLQAVANYIESAKQQNHLALSHVISGHMPWSQEQQQSMQIAGDFIDKVLDNRLSELVH